MIFTVDAALKSKIASVMRSLFSRLGCLLLTVLNILHITTRMQVPVSKPKTCFGKDKLWAYTFLSWEIVYKVVVAYTSFGYNRCTSYDRYGYSQTCSYTLRDEGKIILLFTAFPIIAILGIFLRIKLLKHIYLYFNALCTTAFTMAALFCIITIGAGPVEVDRIGQGIGDALANRSCEWKAKYATQKNPLTADELTRIVSICVAGLVVCALGVLYMRLQSHIIAHILVHEAEKKHHKVEEEKEHKVSLISFGECSTPPKGDQCA